MDYQDWSSLPRMVAIRSNPEIRQILLLTICERGYARTPFPGVGRRERLYWRRKSTDCRARRAWNAKAKPTEEQTKCTVE